MIKKLVRYAGVTSAMLVGGAVLYAVTCLGSAHAATVVTDGPVPYAGALADSTATWLLGALVALKFAEMVLSRIAPLTKTKLDDNALAAIHTVRETAEEILSHVKTPTSTTTVVVAQPAVSSTATSSPGTASGTIEGAS